MGARFLVPPLLLLLLLLLCFCLLLPGGRATNPDGFPNALGRIPLRGVRTWNSYRESINQSLLAAAVDGLTAPLPLPSTAASLAAAGYTDFGIDDGWEACGAGVNGSFHDPQGNPLIDLTLFPDMAALTARASSQGLTMSWYFNCCGCATAEHRLSEPHYLQDAAAAVRYGFSGIKVDGCGNEPNITAWAVALNVTGVPMMLENCNDNYPFRPATLPDGSVDCPYNFYRTSIDGAPNFRSTISNVVATLPFINVSFPGCFAYPDMLTIGTPAPGFEEPSFFANCNGQRLTDAEARAQFAAFAVLSSPLVLGFDTSNATERALWAPIVTHAPTLNINAAWDGEAGRLVAVAPTEDKVPVAVGGACELVLNYTLPQWLVVGKRLARRASDGATARFAAVLLVGDWGPAIDFVAPLSAMGFPPGATVQVADGWTGQDLGTVSDAWTGSGVAAPGGFYRIFALPEEGV